MNHLFKTGICTAAIMVLTACNLEYGKSEDFEPQLGTQNPVMTIKTATPSPDPGSMCELKFLSPSPNASLPNYGPVDFSWSFIMNPSWQSHFPYFDFVLVIKYPGGNPVVDYKTHDQHKTLYMENYEPGGTYTAQVSAVTLANEVLCWDQISFTKDEFTPQLNPGPAIQGTPCLAGACP